MLIFDCNISDLTWKSTLFEKSQLPSANPSSALNEGISSSSEKLPLLLRFRPGDSSRKINFFSIGSKWRFCMLVFSSPEDGLRDNLQGYKCIYVSANLQQVPTQSAEKVITYRHQRLLPLRMQFRGSRNFLRHVRLLFFGHLYLRCDGIGFEWNLTKLQASKAINGRYVKFRVLEWTAFNQHFARSGSFLLKILPTKCSTEFKVRAAPAK